MTRNEIRAEVEEIPAHPVHAFDPTALAKCRGSV